MTRAPSEPMGDAYAECAAADCRHWRQLHSRYGCIVSSCRCEGFAGGRLRTPARMRLPPIEVVVELAAVAVVDVILLAGGGNLSTVAIVTALGVYVVGVSTWGRRERSR